MCMSDSPSLIDEVECWPVVIIVFIPECEFIIEDDWIVDIIFLDRCIDIGTHFLIGEFWGMHSDDDKSLVSILPIPRRDIRKSTLTVDTSERPEVDKDDFASKRLHSQGIRVDPLSQTCWDLWCEVWSIDRELGTRKRRLRY